MERDGEGGKDVNKTRDAGPFREEQLRVVVLRELASILRDCKPTDY